MNLNNALFWLDNNIVDENDICLITKLPIQNKITLQCNHSFEYNALFNHLLQTQKKNNLFHKCPYCRNIYNNYIPYYETNVNNYHEAYLSEPKFNFILDKNNNVNKVFFKNNYLKCTYKYKSGKNKGCLCKNTAHNYLNGQYCNQHNNIINKNNAKVKKEEKGRCCKILKNGNQCKLKIYDEERKLCKRHCNMDN